LNGKVVSGHQQIHEYILDNLSEGEAVKVKVEVTL
jgi:hypothetical protein